MGLLKNRRNPIFSLEWRGGKNTFTGLYKYSYFYNDPQCNKTRGSGVKIIYNIK